MKGLFGRSRIMSTDETLSVCREEGPPLFVDGKPVPRAARKFCIHGNVQPLTGIDLLRVPELDRATERLWLYTNEIDCPLILNDRIERAGLNYQVENVETWGRGPNGYQKARIVRIDVGPYSSPNRRLDEPSNPGR